MTDFVTMVKPVGSLCNMNCSYCYYLKADSSQDPSVYRMKDEVLEQMIRSIMETCTQDTVSFTWHGGEPTLAGIDFYEKAVALQKKYLPKGKNVWNSLQTNGLLINDDWCRFLKKNSFDIGVSVDGTRYVHDLHRNTNTDEDTWSRAAEAVSLLKKHGIQPDLLCTVTGETAANAKAVYSALRRFDTGWIQFIPIVRRNPDDTVTEDSVKPDEYGKFLKEVFREWIKHDLGKLNVQIFAETALVLSGKPSNVCWFAQKCGNVLVAEKDGSVFSCDHFVERNHRIGSFMETSMQELADSDVQTAFGNSKKDSLCRECQSCPWEFICHGCCLKDRFLVNEEGEKKYYLCEGLKEYFTYAVPLLRKAMKLSSEGKTPAQIMKMI